MLNSYMFSNHSPPSSL